MTLTIPDEAEDTRFDDVEKWYCVEVNEFFCVDCEKLFRHIHFEGCVVVWPDNDSEGILKSAQVAKISDRDPHIVEYQQEFGTFIAYEDILRRLEIE